MSDYEPQKEVSLSEHDPKNKFLKLKKYLVVSQIVTVGALILGTFKDSIFVTADVLRIRELLKAFNDIHNDLKWKLVIDGRYHEDGTDIFERYHNGHSVEARVQNKHD